MEPSENSKHMKNASREHIQKFVDDLRCVQCDHYVNGEWSAYDGKVYCQECWDINREREEQEKQKEIAQLRKRLAELTD